MTARTNRALSLLTALCFLCLCLPAAAIEPAAQPGAPGVYVHPDGDGSAFPHPHPHVQPHDGPPDLPPGVLAANDSLDLEDRQGYTTQYIFGMTKAIVRSTLEPALKPAVLILTVPLDIAFLPFAAIAGFFR